MGEVVQFVPRVERDASSNLAEFIRLAKDDLTAFSNGGAWDSDKWQHEQTVVVFATKTMPVGTFSFTPMAEPFKQFAKAYIRYGYSHKPLKDLAPMLQALRCIEAGLLSGCGRAEIGKLSGAIMDVCAAKCREFYSSADVWCNTGRQMQRIFDFVREKRIVPSLPLWKSPFKKPVILTEDLSDAGQAHRSAKLPSNEDMLAVADVFAQADCLESRFFSSIFILLMATPSRISEVLQLPTDCLQWEDDERGVPQMFLRWHAAKGKGATKKWVIPAMHDVVKEAVRRLVEVGEPARGVARKAFAHPSESWAGEDTSALVREFGRFYWPFISDKRTVNAWDALCLHRDNEFSREREIRLNSWRTPDANEVNRRLGSGSGSSLFDRRGMRRADGSRIKLTTHQLRHWLSTMSERAGMDDYTLAQWAGRARAADNRHYDHRSPEERLNVAREILQIQQTPLLERFKGRQPVTYQELGVDRLGTAKATLYGMCVHDYAMAPCQKQRECMTCKEHVCIKGDHATLDRIRLLEAQTELLLKKAEQAHGDGDFGADRWVDNHKWKLAHVRAMRVALEHPQTPDGALLRIPDGHDPSAVRRALMDLGMVDQPEAEAPRISISPLALN